jgi:HD-like signal output (HDOD) protein
MGIRAMRVVCPACKQVFEIEAELVLSATETLPVACRACRCTFSLGVVDVRLPPPPEAPVVPVPRRDEPVEDRPQATGLKSHILRSLVNLPDMPLIILKARQVMDDPDSGLRDLAQIIENDQTLDAKVLSLANSAYYGISGQVATVQHASVLLGLKVLGELIIMSAASALFNRELNGYGLAPSDIWRHSIACALCAQRVAETRFPRLADHAFLAGLMHDAGKIILDPFIRRQQEAITDLDPAGPPPEVDCAVEKELLGFDHAEIIARACRFWRFPEPMLPGLRYHHNPSQSSGSELACIVHLANVLAHRAGFGACYDRTALLEAEGTLSLLQIDAPGLDALQAETADSVAKLEETMRPDAR